MDTPKDTSSAEPKRPHFLHPLGRVLVLIMLPVATVALFYAFENWRGNRAWDKFRQAAEARGEPLEIGALATRHRLRDQGSDPPFAKELADFGQSPDQLNQLFNWVSSQNPDRQFEDLVTWAEGSAAIRSGQTNRQFDLGLGDTNAGARCDAAVVVLEALAPQAPFMDKLRAACQGPDAPYPFGYDSQGLVTALQPGPRIFPAISVCRHLRLKASAELAAARNAEAIRDFELMLCLSDSLRDDPRLIAAIGSLVYRSIALRFPWEGLALRCFTDPELQHLEQLLGSEDLVANVPRVFRGERAQTLAFFDWRIATRRLDRAFGTGSGTSWRDKAYHKAFHLMPASWIRLDKLNYATWMEQIIVAGFQNSRKRIRPGAFDQACAEVYRQMAQPEEFRHLLNHTFISAVCMAKVQEFAVSSVATQVTIDQTRLACGLERYYIKHAVYPARLEELVPEFFQTMPSDPLSAEPYRYQREENGRYKIWSIGWNEKDDEGKSGVTLFDAKAGDWVWRYP
jgi:hypothetical protein